MSKWLNRFWADESGAVMTAEAVILGTVAVVGVTTGLSVVSKAVNEELQEVGFAIRSLDQSYSIPGQVGCGAFTASSSYTQPPVEESIAELCELAEEEEKKQSARQERLERALRMNQPEDKRKSQRNRPDDKKKQNDRRNRI